MKKPFLGLFALVSLFAFSAQANIQLPPATCKTSRSARHQYKYQLEISFGSIQFKDNNINSMKPTISFSKNDLKHKAEDRLVFESLYQVQPGTSEMEKYRNFVGYKTGGTTDIATLQVTRTGFTFGTASATYEKAKTDQRPTVSVDRRWTYGLHCDFDSELTAEGFASLQERFDNTLPLDY